MASTPEGLRGFRKVGKNKKGVHTRQLAADGPLSACGDAFVLIHLALPPLEELDEMTIAGLVRY
jgi:hypothetical protein